MCDPTGGVATMMIMTAISAGIQMDANNKQADYEQGVAEYNAREQENEATRTRNAGVEAENDHRAQVRQMIARQQVQAAGRGVEIDSGSALQLQQDTEAQGEIDALRIRGNHEGQASSMERQSELTRNQGKAAKVIARNNNTALGIKAAGSMASSYANFKAGNLGKGGLKGVTAPKKYNWVWSPGG